MPEPIRARGANRDMDTDQVMTQRKGMTAGGLAVCIGFEVIVAFLITSRSAGGGVAGLLENVAGLFIVLLLLIGLDKLLSNRTE
jgi:predicted cobalt transporter CbtA